MNGFLEKFAKDFAASIISAYRKRGEWQGNDTNCFHFERLNNGDYVSFFPNGNRAGIYHRSGGPKLTTMSTPALSTQSEADHAIWEKAHENTIKILEQHGNIVSKLQNDELHKVLGTFVYTIAHPEQKRRRAFP